MRYDTAVILKRFLGEVCAGYGQERTSSFEGSEFDFAESLEKQELLLVLRMQAARRAKRSPSPFPTLCEPGA